MDTVITAEQIAWRNSHSGNELEAFLALGEPSVGAFSRAGGQLQYAAMLQGTIIGEERFDDPEEARRFAEIKQREFATHGAKVQLPPRVADTTLRTSYAVQQDLCYTLDGIFDLRSQYVEYDNASRTLDGNKLVEVVFNLLDPAQHNVDASVRPLVDALPTHLIDDLRNSNNKNDDDALCEEISMAWFRAGFFGYLLSVSMPVRQYRKSTDGYTFSLGYRMTGIVYVDDLHDRSILERWAQDHIARFQAAAQ